MLNEQCEKVYDRKLSNIVYMGMGEPLLNYKNVLKSIDRITAADSMAMSPKRITVSTAGVAKMIKQLGDDQVRFNLALSLHAPTDKKRNEIMPINETNTIELLMTAAACSDTICPMSDLPYQMCAVAAALSSTSSRSPNVGMSMHSVT